MPTTTTIDRPVPGGDTAAPVRPRRNRRRLIAAAILVAIIVVLSAALLVWQRLDETSDAASEELGRARSEASVAMAQLATATDQRVAALQNDMRQRSEELLLLSAGPLAWAVRDPLARQDFATIGHYFRELARQPMVRRVALVVPDGTVKVASDPDLEGRAAAQLFGDVDLAAAAPRVGTASDQVTVSVPVLGVTERLGTVIVVTDAATGGAR